MLKRERERERERERVRERKREERSSRSYINFGSRKDAHS